ncbi:MAG: acyl-CoA thioesterase [bacterium]|jgi:acyl-CoA thioester hydrolase
MFSFDTQLRVRYADTDQMQVVYHAKLIEYFEVGRTDAIRSLGITYKQVEETGIIMPIVRVECNYLRPARYDELLTIRTILNSLPKDHRIEFDQEIYNEEDKLLCKAKILLYFLDKVSNTKRQIPEMLSKKLNPFFE